MGKQRQPVSRSQQERLIMAGKTATDRYSGMPVIEAKLRRLADAAAHAADAYRDDPVRLKCKKAGIKQFVSNSFFYEELDMLNEAMLRVDNIVRGWEVEPMESPELIAKFTAPAKRRRCKTRNKNVNGKGGENEQT